MNRLRIGLVAPYVSHTAFGVGASVAALSEALCDAGHDVTLISGEDPRSGGIPEPRASGGGRLSVRLFARPYAWNRWLHRAPGMRKWLETAVRDFDVIDLHGIWSMIAAEAGTICERAGVPCVITPHGMMASWNWAKSPLKKRLFFNLLLGKVWRSAAAIRFLSRGEAVNSVIDASGKGVVIPNFVPSPPGSADRRLGESFRSRMGIRPGAPVVLFLGRVSPEKGVMETVDAFGPVAERMPDATLLVVGPLEGEYAAAVRQRVASVPWRDKVRLTGALFGEEKHAALAASTLFVMLTKSEGLPLSVLEALGHGLPVLLSEDSNLPEVGEYQAGVLVRPGRDDVAATLAGLLAGEERLRVMGANSRRLFQERFTSDAVIPRIVSLYETVARGIRPAAQGVARTRNGRGIV